MVFIFKVLLILVGLVLLPVFIAWLVFFVKACTVEFRHIGDADYDDSEDSEN